jgi:hypothetical protein
MSLSKKSDGAGALTPEQIAELERSGREAEVKVELLKLGVSRSQIMELVERYSLERIERQLQWLPLRRARKPSSLIVSAIKEDYELPSAALEQQPENSSSSVIQPDGNGEENEE